MDVFKKILKNKGLKITLARVSVLRMLSNSQKPMDISSIYHNLIAEHVYINQATVYRIIENFLSNDLIRKIQFLDNKSFFELKRKEHHHFVCTKCGTIEDILKCNMRKLVKKLESSMDISINTHSVEYYGLCSGCK